MLIDENKVWPSPPQPNQAEEDIIKLAKKLFTRCVGWEAIARVRFDYDYKFSNADAHNKYQWEDKWISKRELEDRPCLTINKTQIHNLLIINDAKQNKPGVRIRPVGDEATFEAAQIFQEIIYHIEYISNAENVYDNAVSFQVQGGIGYWRILTDYIADKSFDQEIYIRRIKDPRSVYLDPNINEIDGSDANFGFIFDDMPKEMFQLKYPKFAAIAGQTTFDGSADGWITQNDVRVCEFYRKLKKDDKLVTWINAEGQLIKKVSELNETEQVQYDFIKKNKQEWENWQFKERAILTDNIEWYKIAGNRIIEKGPWLGKYIPIVRVVGTETVIEGELDRKGHTRALINPQQMYNVNSPLSLETPLPTPNGWTTMKDVQAGDWLFDEKGVPVQVENISPIQFNNNCYKIEFDDGSSIIADAKHLWTIEERGKRKTATWDWLIKTIPTSELTPKKHFIYSTLPLDLQEADLLIHPYVLGAWLGDGTTANNCITSGLSDMHEMRAIINGFGYEVGEPRIYGNNAAATLTIHGLRLHLTSLNLLNNKHIPIKYLRSSREQRKMLLRGLMDTDGHISNQNKCIFVTTNHEIAKGFSELLSSLGFKPTYSIIKENIRLFPNGKEYLCQSSYRFCFTVDPEEKVFVLNRKAEKQSVERKTHNRRTKRHRIVKIEKIESVPVKCVGINSTSHLFLAGKGMIPTHNSANIEFGALQTKAPWLAPVDAMTGLEEYYRTANSINHSFLPFNHMGEDGKEIPAPTRPAPPQPSSAYVGAMQIAQNEMMMATGQYQSQLGENENAKSGVAINARQRQGDKATYHFVDNQAIAIRYTGKILIDLIPKIYDTKRVMQILTIDGSEMNVTVDPEAPFAFLRGQDTVTQNKTVQNIVFNPSVGLYDLQADTGPSFATRRMEAFNALTQIAAQNKDFMHIGGDILWKVADFPEADVLAKRWRRFIPPNITGDGPDPATEQAMSAAADKIQQMQDVLAGLVKEVADKDKELTIKAQQLDLDRKTREAEQARLDYDAETKRLVALGNSGPGLSVEQIQPIVKQLVMGMLGAGEPGGEGGAPPGPHEGGTPIEPPEEGENVTTGVPAENEIAQMEGEEKPPVPGAKRAPNGSWYLKRGDQYYKVNDNAAAA